MTNEKNTLHKAPAKAFDDFGIKKPSKPPVNDDIKDYFDTFLDDQYLDLKPTEVNLETEKSMKIKKQST